MSSHRTLRYPLSAIRFSPYHRSRCSGMNEMGPSGRSRRCPTRTGSNPVACSPASTRARCRNPKQWSACKTLLLAGITSFIDLTEEGELPEYDHLLPELTEQRIRYRRLPVLGSQRAGFAGAHDTDRRCNRGRACGGSLCIRSLPLRHRPHRHGDRVSSDPRRPVNEAALDHLQTLWRQSARSRRWPSVPETESRSTSCVSGGTSRTRPARETTLSGAVRRRAHGPRARRCARRARVDAWLRRRNAVGAKLGAGGLHERVCARRAYGDDQRRRRKPARRAANTTRAIRCSVTCNGRALRTTNRSLPS